MKYHKPEAFKDFMTAQEVAKYLGNSVESVRNMVWRGYFPAYKPLGKLLFKKVDINTFIESTKQKNPKKVQSKEKLKKKVKVSKPKKKGKKK